MKKLTMTCLKKMSFSLGAVLLPLTMITPALASQVTSYTYNTDGLVSQENGPRTDVTDTTSYAYTTEGQLTLETNALGHETEWLDFNDFGLPTSLIDANGVETEITYNGRKQIIKVKVLDPSSSGFSQTLFTYDAVGLLIEVTLPTGQVLTYTYDDARRLIAVENALGETIEYSLDDAGNRTTESIKSASSSITYQVQQAFDELSRVIQIEDANSDTTSFAYDPNGNTLETINPKNNSTEQTFDAFNRPIKTTEANTAETGFAYDVQGRLISVTDANGNITAYTYDAYDNVIEQSSPDTGTTTYTYDAANNLTSATDSRNITVEYSYDALNRLTEINYPGSSAEDIEYSYDAAAAGHYGIGRVAQITDASGSTTYEYNYLGLINKAVSVIHSQTYTTNYHYNAAGQLLEVVYPNSLKAQYAYDSQGRISDVAVEFTDTSVQPLASDIEYLPFGSITEFDYGNAIHAANTYNTNYQLTSQIHGSVLNREYTYDANGNITDIETLETSLNDQTFVFDNVDRLSEATGQEGDREFAYDLVGNRTSFTLNTNNSLYDYITGSNKLAEITGAQSREFTYNAAGHLIIDEQSAATFNSTYNHAGRLASISDGTTSAAYSYNALGQRALKTVNSQQTRFVFDANGALLQEIKGTQTKTYFYLAGQPLAVVVNTPSTTDLYYYHNDHLGTPQVMTDEGRNVVWKASYAPFGEANLLVSSVENNLRFPGQYYDAETGTHYNYFRDYDPSLGRYLQSDPIGLDGGVNTYGYAYQNPLIYTDPEGLTAIPTSPLGLAITTTSALCYFTGACQRAADAIKNVCNEYFNESADDEPKAKKKAGSSKPGDRVRTPDTHPEDFTNGRSGEKRNKNTGEEWQRSKTNHSGSEGGEWKVGRKPGKSPTPNSKVTVSSDGKVIKVD